MNTQALDLIKNFEGCKLIAYQDKKGVWTIGYGATGPDIKEGTVWSQQQAENDLLVRVTKLTDQIIPLVVHPLSSSLQAAAIISFCYNCGLEAFKESTILKCINSGDFFGATKAFASWDHIGQREDKGLLVRRLMEATTFLKGTP